MIITNKAKPITPAERATRMLSHAPLARSFNKYLGVVKRVVLVGLHLVTPSPSYPFGHKQLKVPGELRQ